jgi:maleate isomerase
MQIPKRIGIVIPSSNVVIEPLVAQRFRHSNNSVHFSRLGVSEINLDSMSLEQFEMQKQLVAAKQLCDARVDAIVWGGTSASWLGFERDEAYCQLIEQETAIPTTTCMLEINQQATDLGAQKLAIVTPYTDDVHNRILDNYEHLGFPRPTGINLGKTISNDFASIGVDKIEQAVKNLAKNSPDVIVIMCTNLKGACVADNLSKSLHIPVIDSAVATLQAGLRIVSDNG